MDVAGICTWTMRKRSYVGALQIGGKILRLNTLRYADEVISVHPSICRMIPLSEKELKIGSDLINQLTAPFQPQKFENEHQKKLQELIDKKARGEKIAILRPRRLKPTTPDKLLQALEASSEEGRLNEKPAIHPAHHTNLSSEQRDEIGLAGHLERDDQFQPGGDSGAVGQGRRARPGLLSPAPQQGLFSPLKKNVLSERRKDRSPG